MCCSGFARRGNWRLLSRGNDLYRRACLAEDLAEMSRLLHIQVFLDAPGLTREQGIQPGAGKLGQFADSCFDFLAIPAFQHFTGKIDIEPVLHLNSLQSHLHSLLEC